MSINTTKTLDPSPFKHMVMTVGNLPSSFVASMSYYEALAWLCHYLETEVIPTVNNNSEVTTELQEKFVELKDYVEHYFENLDVQEEINNKLDELVESGELQRILNSPATTDNLGGVMVGDGLSIEADGTLSVKAGDGITVNGDGVSETPYDDYLPIDVNETHFIYGDTDTRINYSIVSGDYKPKIVMADPTNADTRKHASEFDFEYKPTLMANLSPWHASDNTTYGALIINHEVVVENNLADGTDWDKTILGIDDDGLLHSINGNTEAENVTNMKYACRTWETLYNGGDINPNLDDSRNPRTFLAQNYNGDYIIGVCGGRTFEDTGMTYADIIYFVNTTLGFNAKLIFNLDGGGSSNLLYHGIRQNSLVNNEDRACPTWLIWSSDIAKHDEVFENQSVNNEKLVDIQQKASTTWISKADLQAMAASGVTVNYGFGRVIEGSLVVLNINFTLSATASAYSYLFEGLPVYSGGGTMYFSSMKRSGTSDSDNIMCQLYLNAPATVSEVEHAQSIRNRFALAAGQYEINICYSTQP